MKSSEMGMGAPEQKTPTMITEKENSELERCTYNTLGISQDVNGNIRVEITHSKTGEEYQKTGLVPKEKMEEFNKIVERLSYDIHNFGEGYGGPEATDKKGIKKIEDLLIEIE